MGKAGRPRGSKLKIQLTSEQRQFFINSQKNGTHAARILGRMRILLLVDEGELSY